MTTPNVVTVTDANLEEEVLKSTTPVLLDLWAEWCGPCRMIGPVVEELSGEFAGRIKVGKLNVDQNADTARKFSVSSIPTLLFFKDGRIVQQLVGVRAKTEIKGHLENLLV